MEEIRNYLIRVLVSSGVNDVDVIFAVGKF
jgi:hypothetical protein